ncbi:MAG: S49 family peptidase [Candidatus Kapabacteria bacterium]|nr:S49 family peptidase [Candidatus Kapabacteria bacterium]
MQDNQTPSPIPPPPGSGYGPRRKSRWWIPVAVIAGLLIIIVAVFGVFVNMIVSNVDAPQKSVDVRDKTVLIVDLSGGLPEYKPQMAFNFGNDGPSGPSLLDVLSVLRKAKTDDHIKGIYLRAGGGGIGMAKLAEVRDAILEFKSSGKFVYSFIEMGTKAHYYLATTADSIFMPQEGLLEFNAFGASAPFMKGMFDKIGVTWHVEQFEEYKSAAESMSRENWANVWRCS